MIRLFSALAATAVLATCSLEAAWGAPNSNRSANRYSVQQHSAHRNNYHYRTGNYSKNRGFYGYGNRPYTIEAEEDENLNQDQDQYDQNYMEQDMMQEQEQPQSGLSWVERQRRKHAYRNAYYVRANGGARHMIQNPSYYIAANPVRQQQTTGAQALLIQTARKATIELDNFSDGRNYILTLQGVEPNLAFFSNQGKRNISKVRLTDFVNSMDDTEDASAALVSTSTTPSNASDLNEKILILSNPQYDQRSQTLRFNIKNLDGSKIRAGSHANPVLLIDSSVMDN